MIVNTLTTVIGIIEVLNKNHQFQLKGNSHKNEVDEFVVNTLIN